MLPSHLLRLSALAIALAAPAAEAAICRVAPAGTTGANGASWSTPMSLQAALGNDACNEIWVRKGLYKPVIAVNANNPTQAERAVSFVIRPGKRVYGGFAGTEVLRDARNPQAHRSVLSGDIGNDDTTDADGIVTDPAGNRYGNSYHVVSMDGGTALGPITRTTVLDGVVITSGHANGSTSDHYDLGGGLFCRASNTGHECSPTLRQLTFSGNRGRYGAAMAVVATTGGIARPRLHRVHFSANHAGTYGGAMYNNGNPAGHANPDLLEVTFTGNLSGSYGGAIYNNGRQGNSSPVLDRVGFSGNSSTYGGAIYNNASSSGTARAFITNATFSGNTASSNGGAIYNETGSTGDGRMLLSHVTFSGNTASNGGAICNWGSSSNLEKSGPTVRNSILWGNSATQSGPEVFNQSAEAVIQDSIVAGGCPTGSACSGLLTGNPALGALADNGGFSRTMKPNTGSSAINTANSAWCLTEDQRGVPRAQGTRCDIGAVEVEAPACYVKHDASGSNNGTSWANAYASLQSALANANCGEIRVARGIYTPGNAGDITASFSIRPGQRVYGGFNGTEATLAQRDPAAHRTVLSGDIDGNDITDANGVVVNYTDRIGTNSKRIVLMDGTTAAGNIIANTVLDGFAITAAAGWDISGGGLYCKGNSSGRECSPTLRNLLFSANLADSGAGIYNAGNNGGRANPTLVNVTFRSGSSWLGGGGMYNAGNNGGDSSPALTNVTFVDNWATAMVNDGSHTGRSSPVLNHVTFYANQDRSDAASMKNDGRSGGSSEPILANLILWGGTFNLPEEAGECGHMEICNWSAQPAIRDSLIAGGCPAGAICGLGVIDANPKLASLANNGGATPTLLPAADSPAIDAGADDDCAETDQRGISRPQGAGCDIGAVERAASDNGTIGSLLFADGFESN